RSGEGDVALRLARIARGVRDRTRHVRNADAAGFVSPVLLGVAGALWRVFCGPRNWGGPPPGLLPPPRKPCLGSFPARGGRKQPHTPPLPTPASHPTSPPTDTLRPAG